MLHPDAESETSSRIVLPDHYVQVARATGQRLTAHPSEFVKLAAPRPELVEESLADLELHGSVSPNPNPKTLTPTPFFGHQVPSVSRSSPLLWAGGRRMVIHPHAIAYIRFRSTA